MKNIFLSLFSVLLVISILVGCSAPKGVDVSDDLKFTVDGDFVVLDSYPGNEENIVIPAELDGKQITKILPSFVVGKNFKSVVLPSQISNYTETESGFALCSIGQGDKQIPINQFTAPGVYCNFFNTNSIWVNGKKYNYDAEKVLTAKALKGIWQTTCQVGGEDSVVYLEFSGNGKQLQISREGKTIKYLFDYTIKDGKISFEVYNMSGGSFSASNKPSNEKGEFYEMERIGDALVMWDENIIFYPAKDLEKLKPESTDVWVYEKCEGGIMITGYKGSAAIPTFPFEIDGQTVRWIKSTVADDYNFTNISINTFDFFKVGDDGHYYLNSFGGYDVVQLGSGLSRHAAYCMFFGKDSIIANDRVYSYNPKNAKFEDFTEVYWTALGNENHPTSIELDFVDETRVRFTDFQDETIITGTYTFNNGILTVSINGKIAKLELLGDKLVCWKGSELFENSLGSGMLTFELPLAMSYNGFANSDLWANDTHGNTLKFESLNVIVNSDGSSAIPSGKYSYRISGNKLLLSSGDKTYTLRMKYYNLVDDAGNVYLQTEKSGDSDGNNVIIF